MKLGDLVSHRRHGFGRIVGVWAREHDIYDIVFRQRGSWLRHCCHRSYITLVPLK